MLTPTALRTVPNIATAPQVPPAPSGIARADTSITLRTPHLAVAGVLLALLVVGVGLLAFAALRRPIAPAAMPSTSIEPAATPSEPDSAPATGPESGPGPNPQADGTVPGTSLAGTPTEPQAPAASPVPAASVPTGQAAAAAPAEAASRPPTPGTAPLSTSPSASKPSTPGAATPQPPGVAAAKGPTTPGATAAPVGGAIATGRPSAPTSTPSTAPAPAGAIPASPPPDATGRGAVAASDADAGGGGSGAPNALPESFGAIKTLVADGTKARELDALLILEPERLVIRNRDNGSVLQTAPYQSIAVATYARARQPRWQEDSSVAPIPKSFSGSGFFLKSSRHWLTLQSKSEFLILRLEDKNVKAILASIEARTGSKIQRPAARD
jgi:hypothetical protein